MRHIPTEKDTLKYVRLSTIPSKNISIVKVKTVDNFKTLQLVDSARAQFVPTLVKVPVAQRQGFELT
jgi:hypothetical protein